MRKWLVSNRKTIAVILALSLLSLAFIPIITSDNNNGGSSGDITIINVYSYPTVGGKWIVQFTTIGQADLIITATNGTTWSNNNNDYDLRFLDLKCCDENLEYEWINGSIVVKNYSCSDIGYEISKVLTSGRHTLMFRFGDDVAYAFNDASNWWDSGWVRRAPIYLNTSSGSTPSNYQVLLNVTYDSNMNGNFSDLRFVNYSDSSDEFNYWIENKSDGNWANVWVRFGIPITTTNTTHAWMYYGNSGVSSTSDKNITMDYFETGSLLMEDTIDQGIVETVTLSNDYSNLAVVAYIATRGGGESIDVRVRNVGSNSFEIFEEEPDDQAHNDETVNWIAAENGSWIGIDGQVRIEAGTHSTASAHNETEAFGGDTVSFSNSLSPNASVLATLNTYNNGEFMSTHIHGVTPSDFVVQQEAGGSGSSVSTETIGWIAFSRGSGTNDGVDYEVDYHAQDGDNDGADDSAETITYSFSGNPCLVVQGATAADTDGYWARGAGTFNSNSANFYAEEDQDSDAERNHGDEGFSWAAFYPIGNITVRKYVTQEPTYYVGTEEIWAMPELSNPNPTNGSTNIDITPSLSIYCNHPQGEAMNLTWYENTTGGWVQVSQNTTIYNGTYYYTYANATNYSKAYYWKVNLSDTDGDYDKKTYYFTTKLISSSIDPIVPYVQTSSPFTINATADSNLDKVALWYRYAADNSSFNNTIGEIRKLTSVDDSWTTLNFWNMYTSPVVVCTYNLASSSNNEVVVRVSNVTSSSCDIRIQNPGDDHPVTAGDVCVIVMEEGAYDLEDGRKVEAYKYSELITSENNDWTVGTNRGYTNSYTNPVVLGQVMSQNDTDWSVFWCSNGVSTNPPDASNLYTCKHVGEDTDTIRITETIGYIVIEQGTGTVNEINYRAELGADTIEGVGTGTPPDSYNLGGTYAVGVATHSAMDGTDGGWVVLYGNSPIDTSIDLAIDEDTIGDIDRGHTTEQVAYWVFNSEGNITTTDIQWQIWNNVSNPDTNGADGWSWDFDVPNGTGYYEFYSMGNKSGSPNETAPDSADAICYYSPTGSPPTIELVNPSPNGTIGVNPQPMCQIWANDIDSATLTVYWYENTTGPSWVLSNINSSVSANSIVNYTFTEFDNYSNTYWWRVAVNDSQNNVSAVYHFTTEPIDTSVDTISPYNVASSLLTINASNSTAVDNVTLWYRYSTVNGTWARYETGIEENVNGWTTVNLDITYVNPVVIITGQEGGDISLGVEKSRPRIRSIGSNSFEVIVTNDTGITVTEDVGYIVMEKGHWEIDGVEVEAGTYTVSDAASHTITFAESFPGNTVVVDAIQEETAVAGSSRYTEDSMSSTGYTVYWEGYDDNSNLATVTAGYIAVELGSSSNTFESGIEQEVTEDAYDGLWEGVSFINTYSVPPVLFTNPIDSNGGDPTIVGRRSLSTTGVDVRCTEGQNQDTELDHATCDIPWIVWTDDDSVDGTDWIEWTNASNPDISSPWSWNFGFPNGPGYYEFYSIGKKSGSPDEPAPSSADAKCYKIPMSPIINSYDLRNATGSKLNNATGLLDVNNEYYFTVNITDPDSWSDIEYINITAWYDNGNDSSIYNQTSGGNLNMFLQYENTTGTPVFRMLWPDDEAQIVLTNCTETVVNSTTRIINISFIPGSQIRWASSNNTWNSASNTTNDLWSWNFNITVQDAIGKQDWKRDEYGIYKHTSISADSDWVDVHALPGFSDDSSIVTLTYSSNYDYNLSIYFEENLTHTTLSGYYINIANNVTIKEDADPGDDITSDKTFTGIGEINAIQIFNTSGTHPSDGISQTVDVQFTVYIPLGTMGGKYTAKVATKISQD